MRIKLVSTQLTVLFDAALEQAGSWENVARLLKVSPRTVREWRGGKYLLPQRAFDMLLAISRLQKETFSPKVVPDFWHIGKAARMGGIARQKLYGELGTPDGRKKGGLNSIKTHQRSHTGFSVAKSIKQVVHSERLAEFMGILLGDGHLSEYQASITTNSITDMAHAKFIQGLIKELFGVTGVLRKRMDENAVTVVASSKNLARFLSEKGMPVGNKIEKKLSAPHWIMDSLPYQKAFIRGLFDTDGSIYLDTHKGRRRIYRNPGWTITSYAGILRKDIVRMLRGLGFSPTCRTSQKSVYLRRRNDIVKYFAEIGTSNKKHVNRYRRFIGRVPKRS